MYMLVRERNGSLFETEASLEAWRIRGGGVNVAESYVTVSDVVGKDGCGGASVVAEDNISKADLQLSGAPSRAIDEVQAFARVHGRLPFKNARGNARERKLGARMTRFEKMLEGGRQRLSIHDIAALTSEGVTGVLR